MSGVQMPPKEPRVEQSTQRILDLLEEGGSKATFFFLSSVAESFPGLVRRAAEAGHEIASHGHAHELVYSQSIDEFREDLAKSKQILEDITGTRLRGYRAPSWSINEDTPWVYDVLSDLGFDYSASLFPFRTYLYGDSKAPLRWFRPSQAHPKMIEVPTSVMEICGQRVPFSGGFYFRFMPYPVIRWATQHVNRSNRPTIFYLHPREIDPGQPRLDLPAKDRFVAYFGISRTQRKLEKLLRVAPTMTIEEHLRKEGALEDGR